MVKSADSFNDVGIFLQKNQAQNKSSQKPSASMARKSESMSSKLRWSSWFDISYQLIEELTAEEQLLVTIPFVRMRTLFRKDILVYSR